MKPLARAAAFAFLAALSWRTVWPSDIGWQVAAGRWIAEHGPPTVDVLSTSARGAPWVELRWLWCALVAMLWDGPGPWAVSLLAALLHVAAFALAWRAGGPRGDAAAHAGFLVLGALVASQRLVARPEAVSYLAFAAMLLLLERDRRTPTRWVFACVAIQALWINTHTMAFLGPVVCGLALVARVWEREQVARAASVFALVCAACFASPYALRLPAFAAQLLAESRDPELRAWIPELAATWGGGGGPLARVAFALLTAAVPAWLLVTRRNPSRFLLLVWIVATALAASSVRHLPLAALAAVAVTGAPRSARGRTRAEHSARAARSGRAPTPTANGAAAAHAFWIVVALAGVWLVATQRFHVLQHDTSRFGLGETPHRYPRATMRRHVTPMRDSAGAVPRVFATPLASSTGLAEGVASHTDLRTEVFGSARLARVRRAFESRADFDRLVAEDGVRVAVADLDATRFVELLLGNPEWRAVHLDEDALVSVRVASGIDLPPLRRSDVDSLAWAARARLPVVRQSLWSGWFRAVPAAAPYHRFGNALALCGRDDLAVAFYRDATLAEPHSAPAHAALGSSLAAIGDTAGAVLELREAARLDRNDRTIRDRLLQIAR